MLARDLPMQVKAPGKAQYPLASVVSCTDSRSTPELVFDPGVGEVGRRKGRPHQYVLS